MCIHCHVVLFVENVLSIMIYLYVILFVLVLCIFVYLLNLDCDHLLLFWTRINVSGFNDPNYEVKQMRFVVIYLRSSLHRWVSSTNTHCL